MTIKNIQIFSCGSCINNLKHILKREPKKQMVFPAHVCYMEHKDYGGILFDTGYSYQIRQNGIMSWLYQHINPAIVNENDEVHNQIRTRGGLVHHIIISHGHPDHIGGLVHYPDVPVYMTKKVYQTIDKRKVKDVIFKNMKICKDNVRFLDAEVQLPILSQYFDTVYDVFGDGSIYGVSLEGHASGQIGLYLPEHQLLLGADSAWGYEFLTKVHQMKLVPRWVQHNYAAYVETSKKLLKFQKDHPDIKILFTHSTPDEVKLCLKKLKF